MVHGRARDERKRRATRTGRPVTGLARIAARIAALIAAVAASASAQPRRGPARRAVGSIELLVEPEAPLVAAGRGTLRVQVRIVATDGWEPASAGPLLVTASAEGEVLEVVRPRLSRLDAVEPAASAPVLRFPLVTRAAGAAVVRVTASAFVCRARRCRALTSTARVTLTVGGG